LRTSTPKVALLKSGVDHTRPHVSVAPPRLSTVSVVVRFAVCRLVKVVPSFHESLAWISQPLLSVDLASSVTWIPSMMEPPGTVIPKLE
jgi:hypothetical protein